MKIHCPRHSPVCWVGLGLVGVGGGVSGYK